MTTYSYPRIVGAVTWRGSLLIGSLGAIYGTVLSPVSGTLAAGLLGVSVGFLVGIIGGLYLSGVTWLCRPVYLNKKFVRFSTISIAFLTLLGTGFYLGFYFSSYAMSLTIIRSAVVVAIACAWSAHHVAFTIVSEELEHQKQLST